MKKLTILVLLLMLIGIATADVYTIGTGTLSQDYIPFYGLYDYSWSKVIYTAAELSTAGLTAGQINGIGFDVGYTPSNYVSVDQRVFMRHTTATAEDNTYPDNTAFQSVYNNDYTWNGSGWHYIMFSTPFTWNGTDNIEILWENWDGDYASGPTFKYTSTSPNYLAAYKYADSTFPAVSGTTTYSRPNIQILTPDVIPPSPATLIAPADGSTLTTWNVNLSWSPSDGAIPTGYTLFYGTTNPPTIEEDLGLVTSFQINNPPFSTEYFWQVVPYNANGSATDCPIWSFTTMPDPTIGTFPWVVDFGTSSSDTFPPMDWTRLSGLYPVDTPISTTSGWIRDEWLNGPTGNNAARVNIYGTGAKYWLATPPIAIPASGYELKFDIALTYYASTVPPTAGEQADDKFIVLVDDNPGMTSPTILREWNNSGSEYTFDGISNTGENHTIDLDDYTGTVYFAFYGESTVSGGDNDFFVDNVTVRETPAGPIFAYSPDAINFGTVMNGPQTGPQNVTITNNGGGTLNISATDISISGTNAAQFSFDAVNLPAALGTGESVVIPVYVTGVTEGPISATLTINYGGTAYDVALSADVLAAGTVIIGDGTAHNSLPINPYFGYTYSQSIFMQSEINTPDQRIEKISYYWNGADATVNSNDWTVYMGHTSATEFTSTTDWIPLANLSQVFSGTVAAPAEAGWVEIVLDSPFVYNNTENLVIAVDENASSYDSSGMYYYTTAASTNRSLRYYSDGTDPDPTSPPTGTQVMAYPNVMLQFGDLPTTPVFSLDPNVTEWNFGELQIGVTASKEFTITNTGAGTLGITNLVVSGDYFSLATPWGRAVNLTTGQSYSFTVTYSPTVLGDHTGLITITDNLSRNVTTVNLSGTCMDPTISTFPYLQDFEAYGDNTLPGGWTRSSLATGWEIGSDLGSTYWSIPTHTIYAAANDDTAGSSGDGSMDILNMPVIDLSGTTPGAPILGFDSYYTGGYGQLAYIEASTDNTTWVNLYNVEANDNWITQSVSLDAYMGTSTVYLRFHADDAGNWASGWAIDNVSINYITEDIFPPTISHYPEIGRLFANTPIEITAEIADSPVLTSGIASAIVHYSTDAVNFSEIAMTNTEGAMYSASIPGQALGTTITYYIEAIDAATTPNTTTTATWDFEVNDPLTLQYDSGTATTGLGSGSTTFGVMTGFANPLGAGQYLQINTVSVGMNNDGTANVHVFTFDSDAGVLVDVITPFSQSFTAGVYLEIPLTDCYTNAGYFYVAFTDVVAPNYFSFDQTQVYYPGTHYFISGEGSDVANLSTVEGVGFPGSWLIRANVEPAALSLATPTLTLAQGTGGVDLSWTAIDGSTRYKVYGSIDPYAIDPWELVATVTSNAYTYTGTDSYKFFKVVAENGLIPSRSTHSRLDIVNNTNRVSINQDMSFKGKRK